MPEQKSETKQEEMNFKIFDLYSFDDVKVFDIGLKPVINLKPKLILKSHGRNVVKHGQTRVNIVERLMNKLAVAGHRGRKHKVILGKNTGKYSKNMKTVLEALKIVADRTKQNPLQVLIKAIENSAPRDEITVIEYGGARYPQAVDVSPIRRVNIALRHIVHGASDKAFNKKRNIVQSLAEEIILASENNGESFSVRKRIELEKQADSAR
ncbi:MAG TPA: 30S ribosomal protein S7 [Candidatus Nanoarchaeia archaeon]|nr:30S ribosomal protein S7 [Candidatus Nanoarchaeia archaeon]